MVYTLAPVKTDEEWEAYHTLRRVDLFEFYGFINVYNPDLPGEYQENHHSLLFKYQDEPIGTVRLDERSDGNGIIRLVVIKQGWRGQGHGRVLSDRVEEYGRALGMTIFYVNAKPEAIPYYEALGYEPFDWDPGELEHTVSRKAKQMRKRLS